MLFRAILSAMALLGLGSLLVRRRASRRREPDERLALKHHSQANRAYRFSLPPQLRPK